MMLKEYYDEPCAGFSIPASEHSTITSWGRKGELDAFRNMLDQYSTGLVACVSDSYNIWDACSKLWGSELRDQIMERDGTLVVRPDSGDPKTVDLKVLEKLGEAFGYTVNEKGYCVLDPHVRMIQGDGINLKTLHEIITHLTSHKWSIDNIAFGCGGGLLQKLDRDTQKFAFKASSTTIDGEERDVYKDPITDPGKRSKRGRLVLTKIGETIVTLREEEKYGTDMLEEVFCDGEVKVTYTLEEIRQRAAL
jgi:nicotinamide phosphoribosyltransferase